MQTATLQLIKKLNLSRGNTLGCYCMACWAGHSDGTLLLLASLPPGNQNTVRHKCPTEGGQVGSIKRSKKARTNHTKARVHA